MSNPASKQPADQSATPGVQDTARTDDLLASGADAKDGARGFDAKAGPQALQTGMEGIAQVASEGQRDSALTQPATGAENGDNNAGQGRSQLQK